MNEGWYEQEMGIKRAIADAIKEDYYTNIELGDFRVDIDEIFIMLATLYDFDMIRSCENLSRYSLGVRHSARGF